MWIKICENHYFYIILFDKIPVVKSTLANFLDHRLKCNKTISFSERNKITSAVILVLFPSKKHKKVVP